MVTVLVGLVDFDFPAEMTDDKFLDQLREAMRLLWNAHPLSHAFNLTYVLKTTRKSKAFKRE